MRTAGAAKKPRYRMGLQLYTVREPMAKDAVVTLKQAAALGYGNFETYGFEPESVKYYGMPAPEFRKVLDVLGLATTTGHYEEKSKNGPPSLICRCRRPTCCLRRAVCARPRTSMSCSRGHVPCIL